MFGKNKKNIEAPVQSIMINPSLPEISKQDKPIYPIEEIKDVEEQPGNNKFEKIEIKDEINQEVKEESSSINIEQNDQEEQEEEFDEEIEQEELDEKTEQELEQVEKDKPIIQTPKVEEPPKKEEQISDFERRVILAFQNLELSLRNLESRVETTEAALFRIKGAI